MPDPNAAMMQTRPTARITIVRIRGDIRALLTRHAARCRAQRPYPPRRPAGTAGLVRRRRPRPLRFISRNSVSVASLWRRCSSLHDNRGLRAVTMAALRVATPNPGSQAPQVVTQKRVRPPPACLE
jgi:hypothetical protein